MSHFAGHSLGRQLALQFLFSLEFIQTPWRQALEEFWHMDPVKLTRTSFDRDEMPAVLQYKCGKSHLLDARLHAEGLIVGVCECAEELDAAIVAILDNWKPERVGRIEWVIMRLAFYEMRACPETPVPVVMSEAIRLANIFCDKDAARFVNGLLERLREALERGEDAGHDAQA